MSRRWRRPSAGDAVGLKDAGHIQAGGGRRLGDGQQVRRLDPPARPVPEQERTASPLRARQVHPGLAAGGRDGDLAHRAILPAVGAAAGRNPDPLGCWHDVPRVDYEVHGRTYTRHRRPDPRIAAAVHRALGAARTVVNVGAGCGLI